MLINFNYPNSCKPKQVLILPYLSDNSIQMNLHPESTKIFAWLSEASPLKSQQLNEDLGSCDNMSMLSSSQSYKDSVALSRRKSMRFFQFIPEKWLLEEFDMAGIMCRQTHFKD